MYSISIFLFYVVLISGVRIRTQRTPLPTGLRNYVSRETMIQLTTVSLGNVWYWTMR